MKNSSYTYQSAPDYGTPEVSKRLSLRYGLLFGLLSISAILPYYISLAIQSLVLANALIEWIVTPKKQPATRFIATITLIILSYWFILIFHPNVPDLGTGLVGFRKSAYALGGLLFGLAVRRQHLNAASDWVAYILAFAVTLSVVSHFWLPSLTELAISEDAQTYTSQISGQRRMQGIFAGPFHASIAAGILFAWALANWKSRKHFSTIIIIIAVTAIYLTLVRTIYVAIAVIILISFLISPNNNLKLKRTAYFFSSVIIALVTYVSITGSNPMPTLLAMLDVGQDRRFTNRFADYEYALRLIGESPIWGWGSGAAGDTLLDAFSGGIHVTSHNISLKMAVEGGVLGLSLWVILLFFTLVYLDYGTKHGKIALACVSILWCMGLTGSAIEAIPPTFFLFILVGLGIRRNNDPNTITSGTRF